MNQRTTSASWGPQPGNFALVSIATRFSPASIGDAVRDRFALVSPAPSEPASDGHLVPPPRQAAHRSPTSPNPLLFRLEGLRGLHGQRCISSKARCLNLRLLPPRHSDDNVPNTRPRGPPRDPPRCSKAMTAHRVIWTDRVEVPAATSCGRSA